MAKRWEMDLSPGTRRLPRMLRAGRMVTALEGMDRLFRLYYIASAELAHESRRRRYNFAAGAFVGQQDHRAHLLRDCRPDGGKRRRLLPDSFVSPRRRSLGRTSPTS